MEIRMGMWQGLGARRLLAVLAALCVSGLALAQTAGKPQGKEAAAKAGAGAGAVAGMVPQGGSLREATLRGLNGPDRKLSQYRGKPLVINVWASWCGPCRMEMASLERLAWNNPARSYALIGISTDDSAMAAKNLLRLSNATLNHYIDHALELETMLGADRLPLTVVVDANGRVLGRYYGAREWDGAEAQQWIASLLRKAGS